jgi:hypothetical protein
VIEMPVRAIKEIISQRAAQSAICIKVPDVILDAFKIGSEHEFVCEIKRHFDKDKKLIHEINETANFSSHGHILSSGRILELAETAVAQKYGFAVGDYIEMVFMAVIEKKKRGIFSRKEEETIKTEIFPDRMIDDLDFSPD